MQAENLIDHQSFRFIYSDFQEGFKPLMNGQMDDEEKWLQHTAALDAFSVQKGVIIFLWNAYKKQFIFMSDKKQILGGYPSSAYTADDGIAFSFSKFHPDAVEAVMRINETIVDYHLENKTPSENAVLCNANWLYRKMDGEYFQFLQQIFVTQTEETGCPVFAISFAHDITHLKKNHTAGLTITSPTETIIYDYDFENKELKKTNPISEQEKKVLLHLEKGLNSKKIGELLFLSSHTVDTYRRSLLKKTNCVDTTALVTYCKMVGIL